MKISGFPGLCVAVLVMALVSALPVRGQFGGGGGGGMGNGIPLGSGGSSQDANPADKPDAKSASERPVTGVVTDAQGNPVKGALVQLKDLRTKKTRSVITRDKGEYTFSGLSKTVDYEVTAVFNDHSSAPHNLTTFDSRPRPVVNLQIK